MTIVAYRAAGTVELERGSPVDRARAVQNAQNAFRTAAQAVSFSLTLKNTKNKNNVWPSSQHKDEPETAVMIVAPLR